MELRSLKYPAGTGPVVRDVKSVGVPPVHPLSLPHDFLVSASNLHKTQSLVAHMYRLHAQPKSSCTLLISSWRLAGKSVHTPPVKVNVLHSPVLIVVPVQKRASPVC